MQYQVTITLANAEDLFDIAKQLESLRNNPNIKVAAAVPRPEQPKVQQQGVLGIPPGTSVTAPVPEGTKPINMKTGKPVE